MTYISYISLIFLLITKFTLAETITRMANLSIHAQIISSCHTVGNLVEPLDFGLHYFINLNQIKSNGALRIICTPDIHYQILLGSGQSGYSMQRYLTNNITGEKIKYNLYTDAQYKIIWDDIKGLTLVSNGKENSIPIYGLILAQNTPLFGKYTDIIRITIQW
ncbi:MAG: spore coat U domain-containing protein [Candidatus Dasytiphilus stammeri]